MSANGSSKPSSKHSGLIRSLSRVKNVTTSEKTEHKEQDAITPDHISFLSERVRTSKIIALAKNAGQGRKR
jgi:hypothetical protein